MQTRILFLGNGDDFLLNKAFDLWHAVAFRQQTIFSVLDCHLTFLFIYLKLITHNMSLLIKMTVDGCLNLFMNRHGMGC